MKNSELSSRGIAVKILDRVFRSDSYADILINSTFSGSTLSEQDRRFISELVYGTLRWFGKIDYILRKNFHGRWKDVPPTVKRILETALYQVLFLDRTPNYAAVDEAVSLAKKAAGIRWGKTVNGMLRSITGRIDSFETIPFDDPIESLAVNWSHPQWLVKRLVEWLGIDRTRTFCEANNQRPDLSLRVNRLRVSVAAVLENLSEQNYSVSRSELLENYICINKPGSVTDLDVFRRGEISVQDVSAGLPVHLLEPSACDIFFDVTAAPGGKSSYFSELSDDRATVYAADYKPARSGLIVQNRERLGIENLHVIVADGRAFALRSVANKVMLDAPCSGLGVIRRRGELRWRKSESQIRALSQLQATLLQHASQLVVPGGLLVYSTCTILPEENEEIVECFLKENSQYNLEPPGPDIPKEVVESTGFIRTWPELHDADGSFAALMRRK